VGYADLFVLSKEALWDALQEYPEARTVLIEKGRQMLRKDNLLDEDIAKQQDLEQLTMEQKVSNMETALDNTQTRLARLMADFNSVQAKLKQRVTKLENSISVSENASLYSFGQHQEDATPQKQAADRPTSRLSQDPPSRQTSEDASTGDAKKTMLQQQPAMDAPGPSSDPRNSLTVPSQTRAALRRNTVPGDSDS
jgi:hypothetical protein